jgi:hypothetical protein
MITIAKNSKTLKSSFTFAAAALTASLVSTTFATKPASAVSLGTLIDAGDTLSIGDFTFSDFRYVPTAVGPNAIPVPASSIEVETVSRSVSGDLFQGLEFFLPLAAGNASVNDGAIEYLVTSATGTINQALLSFAGVGLNGGSATIGETIFSNPQGLVVGSLAVGAPDGPFQSILDLTGQNLTSLLVLKDANANAGSNGTAQISIINQLYNPGGGGGQTIPEPSQLLGALAVGAILASNLLQKRKQLN